MDPKFFANRVGAGLSATATATPEGTGPTAVQAKSQAQKGRREVAGKLGASRLQTA